MAGVQQVCVREKERVCVCVCVVGHKDLVYEAIRAVGNTIDHAQR